MQPPLHRIRLAPMAEARGSALEEVRQQLGAECPPGRALLDCADRPLTLPELRAMAAALREKGLELQRVEARDALSLVPAAALGLETALLVGAPPSAPGPPAGACAQYHGGQHGGELAQQPGQARPRHLHHIGDDAGHQQQRGSLQRGQP